MRILIFILFVVYMFSSSAWCFTDPFNAANPTNFINPLSPYNMMDDDKASKHKHNNVTQHKDCRMVTSDNPKHKHSSTIQCSKTSTKITIWVWALGVVGFIIAAIWGIWDEKKWYESGWETKRPGKC